MFGFRGNNTKRKVHSNHTGKWRRGGNGKPSNSPPRRGHKAVVRQSAPATLGRMAQEQWLQGQNFNDNDSVDMSLYTTQSKATVRYPPRLLNHSFDDVDDGMSSLAPSEFTTEVALNRYTRLGGSSWTPPTPLHYESQVKSTTQLLSPRQEDNDEQSFVALQKSLTPETDPCSSKPSFEEEEGSTFHDDDDGEATLYSILPATAKMAKLALEGSPPRSPPSDVPPNSHSNRANTNLKDQETTKTTKKEKKSSHKSPHGPIDLDESVVDSSSSAASSSNSWVVSGAGLASPRIYNGSPTRTPQKKNDDDDDNDTYGFSVADHDSIMSPPSLLGSSLAETPSVNMNTGGHHRVSSGSVATPLSQSLERDFPDDDTYGFSTAGSRVQQDDDASTL